MAAVNCPYRCGPFGQTPPRQQHTHRDRYRLKTPGLPPQDVLPPGHSYLRLSLGVLGQSSH